MYLCVYIGPMCANQKRIKFIESLHTQQAGKASVQHRLESSHAGILDGAQ